MKDPTKEPDFVTGTLFANAVFGAILIEHTKKCEPCARLFLAIHDHVRGANQMNEWEKDRGDLLEGIEVFVEEIREAKTEEEFHRAVSALSFIVRGTLPVLPEKEKP